MKIVGKIGLRQALWEFRHRQTVPWREALRNWFRNSSIDYRWIPRPEWSRYKKSDTVFVFGSGPSVNALTPEQWDIIRAHDSIGLNFAFLANFPMTYFYLGYEPSSNESLRQAFSAALRQRYSESLWFVPTKVLCRLVHPRTVPEFFPFHPQLALFDLPPALRLDANRPFARADFDYSLVYRGVMGVGLHLVHQLGYRKIVLVGVDLNTHHHFFDDHPAMREERQVYNQKMSSGGVFESMIPKDDKYRTMEEYYYALQELFFGPQGVQLYVSNENNLLSPRLPRYPGFVPSQAVNVP